MPVGQVLTDLDARGDHPADRVFRRAGALTRRQSGMKSHIAPNQCDELLAVNDIEQFLHPMPAVRQAVFR